MALKIFLVVAVTLAIYLPQVSPAVVIVPVPVPNPVPAPLIPRPVPLIPRPVPLIPQPPPLVNFPSWFPWNWPFGPSALRPIWNPANEVVFLGQWLLEVLRFINISVATGFASAEAALAAADATAQVIANAIASGLNATSIASSACSLTASAGIQGVLEEFGNTFSGCIETEMNQLRATVESLETAATSARSILTSVIVELVTCIKSAYEPGQITSCIQGGLPNGVASVSSAFSKVNLLLGSATIQSEVLPLQARLCTIDASATTQPAIVTVFNEIQQCLTNLAPPHESDMRGNQTVAPVTS